MHFLLSCARGEFLTFLNDDDALVAGTLEEVRKVLDETSARLVAWPYCNYFYSDWHDRRHRNTLIISPHSARLLELRTNETLQAVYHDFNGGRLPTGCNAAAHRSLFETASQRVPRLFPSMAGDVYAGVVLLSTIDTYWWIDSPLTLFGRWTHSLGSSLGTRRSSAAQTYAQEFPEEAALQRVPLKALTSANLLAEALLRAQDAAGLDPAVVSFNWVSYFVRFYKELLYRYTQGGDVKVDLAEFHSALSRQPDALAKAVTTAIAPGFGTSWRAWRPSYRRLLNRVSLLGWLEAALRPSLAPESGGVVYRGDVSGFSTILECARFWEQNRTPVTAGTRP